MKSVKRSQLMRGVALATLFSFLSLSMSCGPKAGGAKPGGGGGGSGVVTAGGDPLILDDAKPGLTMRLSDGVQLAPPADRSRAPSPRTG